MLGGGGGDNLDQLKPPKRDKDVSTWDISVSLPLDHWNIYLLRQSGNL